MNTKFNCKYNVDIRPDLSYSLILLAPTSLRFLSSSSVQMRAIPSIVHEYLEFHWDPILHTDATSKCNVLSDVM
jgi:hypothetical protein